MATDAGLTGDAVNTRVQRGLLLGDTYQAIFTPLITGMMGVQGMLCTTGARPRRFEKVGARMATACAPRRMEGRKHGAEAGRGRRRR